MRSFPGMEIEKLIKLVARRRLSFMRMKIFLLIFMGLLGVNCFAETLVLDNGDILCGKICFLENDNLYLCNEKVLYIVSIPRIKKIIDDQDCQLQISELEKRDFPKLNYNSFLEIKEIKDQNQGKGYSLKYFSKRFGTYYDRRVNKMIYGSTARIMESGISSVSSYDILLLNFCTALSNKFDTDFYLAGYAGSYLFMINLKYALYSSHLLQLALKSGYQYSYDDFPAENSISYYGFPQSLLITLGNIDYFLTGNLSIVPATREDNNKTKYITPVTYHLGISLRLLKHLSVSAEMFNSLSFSERDGFKDFDQKVTLTGLRFFWSRNSLDLGLMDTYERSDRYWPIVTFTHHFSK